MELQFQSFFHFFTFLVTLPWKYRKFCDLIASFALHLFSSCVIFSMISVILTLYLYFQQLCRSLGCLLFPEVVYEWKLPQYRFIC